MAELFNKAKRMVRLRNEDFPLNIALNVEKRGEIRASLRPNQWTEVDDAVYTMLKDKFAMGGEREANNFEMTPGGAVSANRMEPKPGYTIEFKGD